jgi:hypothetical protein
LLLLESRHLLFVRLGALLRLETETLLLRLEHLHEVGTTFSLEAVLGRLHGVLALDATVLLVQEEVLLHETTTGLLRGAVENFSSGTDTLLEHVYIIL